MVRLVLGDPKAGVSLGESGYELARSVGATVADDVDVVGVRLRRVILVKASEGRKQARLFVIRGDNHAQMRQRQGTASLPFDGCRRRFTSVIRFGILFGLRAFGPRKV